MKQAKKKKLYVVEFTPGGTDMLGEPLHFYVRYKWHTKENQWRHRGLTSGFSRQIQTYTRKRDAYRGLNRYIADMAKSLKVQFWRSANVLEIDS